VYGFCGNHIFRRDVLAADQTRAEQDSVSEIVLGKKKEEGFMDIPSL
jgi:hypothetical protein